MAGVEDDILVETVRNFSVLYDKAHADFHRKDVKKNAWNAVAEALGMEDGNEAEKSFNKLRDKYVRAKREMKLKNQSGTSAKAVRKVREKIESLQFLQWLDEYIKPRQSKSNVNGESDDSSGEEEGSDKNQIEDEEECFDTEERGERDDTTMQKSTTEEGNETQGTEEPKKKDSPNKEKRKERLKKVSNAEKVKRQGKHKQFSNNDSLTEIEKEEISLLRTVAGAVSSNSEEQSDKDDFDFFGHFVAKKMRKLNTKLDEEDMADLEFEITNVLERARKIKRNQQSFVQQQPTQPWYYYNQAPGPFMQALNSKE